VGDYSSDRIFHFARVYSLTEVRTENGKMPGVAGVEALRFAEQGTHLGLGLTDKNFIRSAWRLAETETSNRHPYFSDTFYARINLPRVKDAPDQSQESSNSRSPEMERRDAILGVRRHSLHH
jgi:hypothetical protein